MPKEFTPEITEDFYNRLASGIEKRGAQNVGLARSEALSRGLTGDPYEAAAVGSARQGTSQQLGDLGADLAYKVAGFGREERLGRERMDFESKESAKAFERQLGLQDLMATRQHGWDADAANTANRRGYQSALWQLPVGAVGAGLGAGLGRKIGGGK